MLTQEKLAGHGKAPQRPGLAGLRGDCIWINQDGRMTPVSFVNERHAYPSKIPRPPVSPYAFPGLSEGIAKKEEAEPEPEIAFAREPEMAGVAAISLFYRSDVRRSEAMMEVYGELVCRVADKVRSRFHDHISIERFVPELKAAMGEADGPNGFLARMTGGNIMPLFIFDVARRLGIEAGVASSEGKLFTKIGEYIVDPREMSVRKPNGDDEGAAFKREMKLVKHIICLEAAGNAFANDDYAAVLELALKAMEMNPLDSWAHYQAGTALRLLGRPEEAAPHYEEAIRREKSEPSGTDHALLSEYYTQAATLKIELGDFELLLSARGDCDAAVANDNQNEHAYLARARIRRALGEPQEALADLGVAIAVNPKLPEAYGERGELNTSLGRYAEAGHDWRTYKELTGKDWAVLW